MMSLHHAGPDRTSNRPRDHIGGRLVQKSFDDEKDADRNDIPEDGDQPCRRWFRTRLSRAELDHDHYYHHDDHNHGVGGDRRLAKFKQEYQLTAPRSRNRKRGFLFGVSDNETGL